MEFWNLIVVSGFILLYLSLCVVFLNLSKLRSSLRSAVSQKLQKSAIGKNTEAEDYQQCAQQVLRKLTDLELSLSQKLEAVTEKLPDPKVWATKFKAGLNLEKPADPESEQDDYRVAHRLLGVGVDEEKIALQTGIPTEEIKLLKSLQKTMG